MRILLLFIMTFCACCTYGQQFRMGTNINPVLWKLTGPEDKSEGGSASPQWVRVEENLLWFNLQLNPSYYYPIVKFNKNKMSAGINHNASIGTMFPTDIDLDPLFTIDLPQYVMFRYGNEATKYDDYGFGIGIGVGYTYQVIPYTLGTPVICIDWIFGDGNMIRAGVDLQERKLYGYYSSEGLKPMVESREIIVQYSRSFW